MNTPQQSPSPEHQGRFQFGLKSLVDAFLRSPFSGIAPWVLLSLLSGPGRFEEAVCAALGFSVLVLWIGHRRGIKVHALEVFGVVFFAVLAVVGALAPVGTIRWMELWAGELTNIALALFAAATLLIRRPFTLAYAKDSTPPDIWDSPVFLRVNNVITAVWAGAFFFSAAVGCYGDALLRDANNFWTGWILQLAATFLAISFTEFYPDYVQAKAPKETEDSATSPPPSIARLFDWVPTFVLITGIVGLVTDSLSRAVGYTLIAIGAIGSAGMRKFFPANPKHQDRV